MKFGEKLWGKGRTSVLGRGDRLVVSELSRLGRSLGQIVTILDALAKPGVAFVALKENIRVEGKRDIQTKVMTTLFALFAEVERDLISERTREGLARARSSGRKLRRPKGSLGVCLAFDNPGGRDRGDGHRAHRRARRSARQREWTPARHGAWFAERVIAVKLEYELSVDARERDALEALLRRRRGTAELRGRGHHVADGGHQQRRRRPGRRPLLHYGRLSRSR